MSFFLFLFITSVSFNAQALGSKNFLSAYCENLFLTPMILPEKIMKNFEKNNLSNIQEITEVYTVLKGVDNIEGVDKWLYYHSPRSEVQVMNGIEEGKVAFMEAQKVADLGHTVKLDNDGTLRVAGSKELAKDFDLYIIDNVGNIVRKVEVKNPNAALPSFYLGNVNNFYGQVDKGIGKGTDHIQKGFHQGKRELAIIYDEAKIIKKGKYAPNTGKLIEHTHPNGTKVKYAMFDDGSIEQFVKRDGVLKKNSDFKQTNNFDEIAKSLLSKKKFTKKVDGMLPLEKIYIYQTNGDLLHTFEFINLDGAIKIKHYGP